MIEWIDIKERRPSLSGVYLVFSNYGTRTAEFITWIGKPRFQDHVTQNDEGMEDDFGVPFNPTHWAHLPESPEAAS